jgi:hypothetical protein
MKQLILRQKQVIFFIIAGGLSAIVEIGSFKILSVYLPKVFFGSIICMELNIRLAISCLQAAELLLIIF